MLELVKYKSGLFYNDENLDKDVSSEIDACLSYLKKAGVKPELLQKDNPYPLTVTVVVLWVKNSRDSDPKNIVNNPSFSCLVTQLKNHEVDDG